MDLHLPHLRRGVGGVAEGSDEVFRQTLQVSGVVVVAAKEVISIA